MATGTLNGVANHATPFGWLPAWFRTSSLRVAAEPAATSLRLRPRLVDGQIAAADLGGVQLIDRRLCSFVRTHLDERKPARASCRLIAHDRDRFDRSDTGEDLLQFGLSDLVRQVSDIQLPTHTQTPLSHPRRCRVST